MNTLNYLTVTTNDLERLNPDVAVDVVRRLMIAEAIASAQRSWNSLALEDQAFQQNRANVSAV